METTRQDYLELKNENAASNPEAERLRIYDLLLQDFFLDPVKTLQALFDLSTLYRTGRPNPQNRVTYNDRLRIARRMLTGRMK